jgi:hypothetical protein
MRIPTENDYDLMLPIMSKHDISKNVLTANNESTFIMIEKGQVIGLSKYFVHNKIGVINLMAYNINFMDNSYRDAFFRGVLNLMINNGLFEGIIMTTNENDDFYKGYNFKTVDMNLLQELKKNSLNTNEVVNAYKVDITAFFNRPCAG